MQGKIQEKGVGEKDWVGNGDGCDLEIECVADGSVSKA